MEAGSHRHPEPTTARGRRHGLGPASTSTPRAASSPRMTASAWARSADASAQAAMVDATSPRILEGRFVRLLIKAGTTATNYTARVTVGTTYPDNQTGRTLVRSFQVNVYTVVEG